MRLDTFVAGMVVAGACTLASPRLPQVEQAAQATHGGGERYRAHQRCAAVAHTLEDLVACMHDEGYEFLAQRPEYPSPECWSMRRDGAEATSVPPHCFEHAAGTPH